MKLSKFITTPLIFLLIFVITSSCSEPHYTEYKLTVNIHEFNVKDSPDLIDEKPEVFIRVRTESESDSSEIFDAYSKDFVEQGKTYNFSLMGKAHDKEITFSVSLRDDDVFEEVLDTLFGDGEDQSDLIEGTTLYIKIPDGDMSGTVTLDGEDGYLKFSYTIEDLVEK